MLCWCGTHGGRAEAAQDITRGNLAVSHLDNLEVGDYLLVRKVEQPARQSSPLECGHAVEAAMIILDFDGGASWIREVGGNLAASLNQLLIGWRAEPQ